MEHGPTTINSSATCAARPNDVGTRDGEVLQLSHMSRPVPTGIHIYIYLVTRYLVLYHSVQQVWDCIYSGRTPVVLLATRYQVCELCPQYVVPVRTYLVCMLWLVLLVYCSVIPVSICTVSYGTAVVPTAAVVAAVYKRIIRNLIAKDGTWHDDGVDRLMRQKTWVCVTAYTAIVCTWMSSTAFVSEDNNSC